MKIHQQKLNQIATMGFPNPFQKSGTTAQAKTVEKKTKKYKDEKKRAAEFQNAEKNILISRDNQILLSKLVEISNGKWSSVPKAKEQGMKKRISASQPRFQPTSLNLAVRKRETDRIERENHAFAKRLFDKQANNTKTQMDKDFQAHLKYKKQIAKMSASTNGRVKRSTMRPG